MIWRYGRMSGPRCARCGDKQCREGRSCFDDCRDGADVYPRDETLLRLLETASRVEADGYCRRTRLEEVAMFARGCGYSRIGLAFCIGLSSEAEAVDRFLSRWFDVYSVCCKVCGVDKRKLGHDLIGGRPYEAACNPWMQARLLAAAGTQLNVTCGLCVGHDAVFGMCSEAPVVTLIAKDRVLGHNPAAALYCPYVARGVEARCEDDPRG